MKIRWKTAIELEIVTHLDDDEQTVVEIQEFKAGTTEEVDIIDDKKYMVDMQFGDSSIAFCVQKSWFDIIENGGGTITSDLHEESLPKYGKYGPDYM